MKVVVFGSANIDHKYQLSHLVRAGETLASGAYEKNEGGKGFNQAVALAKAGQKVCFAGAIGEDGLFLRDSLTAYGVDTEFLQVLEEPTGHAVIQVDEQGRNSIILYGGANRCIRSERIRTVLDHFETGDVLLLQNEIRGGEVLLREAAKRGLRVALNPSPISADLPEWPLEAVEWFILNEIEAGDLTGKSDPEEMAAELLRRYPASKVVLTLGEQGSLYLSAEEHLRQPAISVQAVDTTAAGDTFTGFFLQAVLNGLSVKVALARASHAASLAVSRPGAAVSIPTAEELSTL